MEVGDQDRQYKIMKTLIVVILLLLLSISVLSQTDKAVAEESNLKAIIKEVSITKSKTVIQLEVSNSSDSTIFIATNPKGYNGLINSSLEVDKERKTIKILSHITNDESACGRPFDSSSVSLLELRPNTTVNVFYDFLGYEIKVQPFCVSKLSPIIDTFKLEKILVSLGYFENESYIEELNKKTISFNKYTFFPEGNINGKRLVDSQKIVEISYRIKD